MKKVLMASVATLALTGAAAEGMALFYGKANCATCHTGAFQTDHGFHAMGQPQLGPGKAARFEDHQQDTGRMRVTGRAGDAYAFRTPPLRNVAQTAPYGHAGAYGTREGVVRHHLDPVGSLRAYDIAQAVMPGFDADDLRVMQDEGELTAIAAANDLAPMTLSDAEVDDILAFLNSLPDPQSIRSALGLL